MFARINKPEALKLAGFALIVGAALFAPTMVQVAIFIGAIFVIVGYTWSRLNG